MWKGVSTCIVKGEQEFWWTLQTVCPGVYIIYAYVLAGPSQPMRPPSEASSVSGSAAIARLAGQNQMKPLSATSHPMKKKERDYGHSDAAACSSSRVATGDQTVQWPQGGRRLDSQVKSLPLFPSIPSPLSKSKPAAVNFTWQLLSTCFLDTALCRSLDGLWKRSNVWLTMKEEYDHYYSGDVITLVSYWSDPKFKWMYNCQATCKVL